MGQEVNLTAHEAFGFTNQAHYAIEFIPSDQAYWRSPNSPRLLTQRTPDGRYYTTISGQSTQEFSLRAPLGNLELVYDRPSDRYLQNFPVGPIGLPSGVTENQFGEMLISATRAYNQNHVAYNLAPDALALTTLGGSNSTGAAFGLIRSQGATLPETSSFYLGSEGSLWTPPLANYRGTSNQNTSPQARPYRK